MFDYPVTLEAGEAPGIIVASFADIPEAITEGDGEGHAREQAGEALGLVLLAYLRANRQLPAASKGNDLVSPPIEMTAKLALISTFNDSGLSRSELARRLGKDEKQVRRLLDPMHGTDLASLETALASMGKKLVLSLEAA
ncbi:type II toxin-antitoxin system HicB family antitoxin [Pararhizobium sp.]|uniref:type II toxin-antitoxin system HicB family antitoxin n=1 Tax=Pararhizobium sp. TaxID=1977563 RepID=UPI002724E5E2|nr:type II toxin-antitoxin system HicB family antitoxin [Pararhizobium sp.]MDO9414616.1 type II toxin-antitoxin system HicB family antitoxin [Pararhizobium sp.]